MKIPTLQESKDFLCEAKELNPGPWVQHSVFVADAAKIIATHHPQLDSQVSYILGYLHDIGRRDGKTGMRHIIDRYNFLVNKGFEDSARICLTHSFPLKNINAVIAEWDCSDEERQFVEDYLPQVEYTEYDRLIQLCDALALPSGFCLIEKRIVDLALRYGINNYTVPRWKATFNIQERFEKAIGLSIYSILPGVVENTFDACAQKLVCGDMK